MRSTAAEMSLFPTFLPSTTGLAAQMQIAQCLSGWEWNRNSLGQDPCAIATMLDANCYGDVNYAYTKVYPGGSYAPLDVARTRGMGCDCNTVMYSLSMACSSCQGGNVYPWDAWAKGCNATSISVYPSGIPRGTAVPHWAFYNVTLLSYGRFNDSVARNIGRDPETNPSGTVLASTDTNGTVDVFGAVVAGVLVLLIILVVVFVAFRRWRRKKDNALRGQRKHPRGYGAQWKFVNLPPTRPSSISGSGTTSQSCAAKL
ncbi:hypothetical protein BJ322DRAFT_406892 [Thelephora terrestris]|uniref:Transmembrane protein n=1 Tax=Thelephora terrestris TaxID=56493 RepID=A0A9P6HMA4_9AGAM|nr:hypothetical protein BJ322DRAFT_406892 [Thelephora terrestris]